MNTLPKEKIIELALKAGFENWSFGLVIHDAYGNGVLVEEQLIEFARLVLAEVAPKPDADGWVTWNGGECPVPAGTRVGVRYRSGVMAHVPTAKECHWKHCGDGDDIVAYRVVVEPKVADSDSWVEWAGGYYCPIPGDAVVEVRLRNGVVSSDRADDYHWSHYGESGDIVAYRVIEGGAA